MAVLSISSSLIFAEPLYIRINPWLVLSLFGDNLEGIKVSRHE